MFSKQLVEYRTLYIGRQCLKIIIEPGVNFKLILMKFFENEKLIRLNILYISYENTIQYWTSSRISLLSLLRS